MKSIFISYIAQWFLLIGYPSDKLQVKVGIEIVLYDLVYLVNCDK